MGIKFTSEDANRLIRDMDSFCVTLQKETIELYSLRNCVPGWEDAQKEVFIETLDMIVKDVDSALKAQSQYIQIYVQKVNELRG